MSTQTDTYGDSGFSSASELEFYSYVFNIMFKEDTNVINNNENKYVINKKQQTQDIENKVNSTFETVTSN